MSQQTALNNAKLNSQSVKANAHTLVIADIHLQTDSNHPINQHFLEFLNKKAMHAEALYILGDLFESWVGDDIGLPIYQTEIKALKALTDAGVKVYFQYGNRDFLMRKKFCQATGTKLLKEPTVIELYGTQYLMLHGDALCTDDIQYQRFKKWVRNPMVQFLFLKLSRKKRLAIAEKMRATSKQESAEKQPQIMDVNEQTVLNVLQSQPEINHLIHGHTHRPMLHATNLNNQTKQRWVLGDWRPQAQIMHISAEGPALIDY